MSNADMKPTARTLCTLLNIKHNEINFRDGIYHFHYGGYDCEYNQATGKVKNDDNKEIKIITFLKNATKMNLDTIAEKIAEIENGEPENANTEKEKRGRKKNSTKVLEALESFTLCHHAGRPFMLYGNQAFEIGSTQYKDFIQRIAYTGQNIVLSDNQVKEVAAAQRGRALFDGEEIPVYVRIAAQDDNRVFVDLNDREKNIIEVTAEGWQIVERPDVFFFRPQHLGALPLPKRPGNIDKLKTIFGLMEIEDFILLRSVLSFWMRGRPGARGTFPILNLAGPAGSGKTTKAKLLKYLIDPGVPEARTPTKEPRDLYISAKNLYILNLDNVSYLDPEMQDALCSLASQGGYARKKNYTDDDEQIFEECRSIILNGINFKARPDLQSRKIDIELSAIPPSHRLTENEIWEEAAKLRPSIFGGLLTALSGALCEASNVDAKKWELPRLADFALFTVALERGNGWPEGETMEALKMNYSRALSGMAEEAAVIQEIIKLVESKTKWEGTATELLDELTERAGDKAKKKGWPDNPMTLARQIQRANDILENAKINIDKTRRSSGDRIIIFSKKGDVPAKSKDGELEMLF